MYGKRSPCTCQYLTEGREKNREYKEPNGCYIIYPSTNKIIGQNIRWKRFKGLFFFSLSRLIGKLPEPMTIASSLHNAFPSGLYIPRIYIYFFFKKL